jgi:hypothetical protein
MHALLYVDFVRYLFASVKAVVRPRLLVGPLGTIWLQVIEPVLRPRILAAPQIHLPLK